MGWKGEDRYSGSFPEPSYRGQERPFWDDEREKAFQLWYKSLPSQGLRLLFQPPADDPEHYYDYRGAFQRGYMPGPTAHWPSDLKYLNHPRRFINGYDTTTGYQAPMIMRHWLEED